MEVHHHSKNHEGKKPGHLFFEFFMLFLAVFAGSVAEYFLEHVVEHNREEQYIESLVEDLKLDTANYTITINDNTALSAGLDTLLDILQQPGIIKADSNTIRKLYIFNRRYTSNITDMPFSTRTITQLKSAGNLRLIHKINVSDSIMEYDQGIQLILTQQKAKDDASLHTINLGDEIFDGRFTRMSQFNSREAFFNQHFRLLTNDSMKLKYYYNNILLNQEVTLGYTEMLKAHKQHASELIAFLCKEYHITESGTGHTNKLKKVKKK